LYLLLISKKQFKPAALRSALLPAKLKNSSHPLTIVMMGVLFALVFDSTTQAAAWAYTAPSKIDTATAHCNANYTIIYVA
jgi:high-affinity nickel-transport protein